MSLRYLDMVARGARVQSSSEWSDGLAREERYPLFRAIIILQT